ncbi:PLDc N-terminal domain-containing protein [Corynebacterium incognita]|uniref:PLDc N-terminal domain-containing protein n=1 Tax=Corynebacterium incognita TaxID=2754725 RepID=A0A7G7CRI4_9CORY|nr:phospholipase D-like domain-containing protein [Corynebacterium incognita]QNE90200.1 PLDc N-terminal domain-containing protein [Corynebacterium incognita]
MIFSVDVTWWQFFLGALDFLIKVIAVGFVPEGRRPSSSTAWLLAILLLPFVGLPLFLLMGSPYINQRRHRIQQQADAMIEDVQADVPDAPDPALAPELLSIVRLNRRLTGFPAVVGHNRGIHADYDETIRRMAEVIDTAEEYVYVEIYIVAWDETTDVLFQALARARQRGVAVKVLLDQIGSYKYPLYRKLGTRLTEIDVDWRLMLPIQPWNYRFRRPDLRNHRKLVSVDGETAFVGSINLVERGYRKAWKSTSALQWIDYMVELTGPIVSSVEAVFAVDWYIESDEQLDVTAHVDDPEDEDDVNYLQMVPSGPGYNTEPVLRAYNSLVHHAKKRLVLCSPYFVPDESLLDAVTSASYRGVEVELYVSQKADQFMVHHAQSSYYQALLEAGIRIFQFPEPFVLHSKFALADPGEDVPLGMFGSSNMDMRSFGLNYETTLLVAKGDIIDGLDDLAENYRRVSHELTLEEWNQRGFIRRYVDNAMRLTSALQ